MAKAARAYHDQLSAEGRAYFESRGFDRQHCVTWGLGYVQAPLIGHEHYQGRVCIPYVSPTGVVQLKFRCIQDHVCKEIHPQWDKYVGLAGNGTWMFNTRAFLLDSPEIVITEGELDAMAVQIHTGMPAIGMPGTQSIQECWFRAFTGYQRVLVVADGDKPGRDAAKATAKQIIQADVIRLPDGEDSSSLLLQPGGLEHFREMCGLEEDQCSLD